MASTPRGTPSYGSRGASTLGAELSMMRGCAAFAARAFPAARRALQMKLGSAVGIRGQGRNSVFTYVKTNCGPDPEFA